MKNYPAFRNNLVNRADPDALSHFVATSHDQ